MGVNTDATTTGRRLNHVEFAHRPGEDGLVTDLFEALGCTCRVIDDATYGKYVVVDLDGSRHGLNDMFVSQVEPEQLALEDALRDRLSTGDAELAALSNRFRTFERERPHRATHVGLRLPSVRALDEVIGRLRGLGAGKLAGRLEVGEPITRTAEDSEATMAPMKQVWFWTDVISTGLLAVGQQFELQAYEA